LHPDGHKARSGRTPNRGALGQILSQNLRGFLIGVAAEKSQFDNFGAIGIDLGQLFQGIVDGHEVFIATAGDVIGLVDGDADALSFLGSVLAGVVHQNSAHLVGGDGEKMLPVVFHGFVSTSVIQAPGCSSRIGDAAEPFRTLEDASEIRKDLEARG